MYNNCSPGRIVRFFPFKKLSRFSSLISFKKPRVDIRKIKQLEKEQERQHMRQLESRIMAEKSLVERVRLKLQLKEEVLNEVRGP